MRQHRGRARIMVFMAVVALTGPALAEAPPPEKEPEVGGLMVQIYDADGILGASAQVTLRGDEGLVATVEVRDNGRGEDHEAQDLFYTAGVPSFTERKLEVEIRSDDQTWTTRTELDPADDKPLVILTPHPDGTMEVVDGRKASQDIRAKLMRHREQQVAPPAPRRGVSWNLVGAIAAVVFGLGLAFIVALWGRRPQRRARLAGDRDHPVIAPIRVDAEEVTAALEDGPLTGMRVVVVGAIPEACAAGIACLDPEPLAVELVAAVERLAAVPGPTVALLVTEIDRLDSHGRVEPVVALERAVAGRFPLWVVDGPGLWQMWPPDGEG